jgi:hypothetical protein
VCGVGQGKERDDGQARAARRWWAAATLTAGLARGERKQARRIVTFSIYSKKFKKGLN